MKRWILLLVLINVAIFMMVFMRRHFDVYDTVKTDLTRKEFNDAVRVLKQERFMWARLRGLSAHLVIKSGRTNDWSDGKNLSFECDVLLQQSEPGTNLNANYIYPITVTISNRLEGWTVRTDGTEKNTTQDNNKQGVTKINGEQLRDIIGLPGLLLWPKVFLLRWNRDPAFPQGMQTFNDVLRFCSPWHDRSALGVPHSYIFRDSEDQFDAMVFTGGHLSRYIQRTTRDRDTRVNKVFSAGNLVEINGFWFPTVMDWTSEDTRISMIISNVCIDVK